MQKELDVFPSDNALKKSVIVSSETREGVDELRAGTTQERQRAQSGTKAGKTLCIPTGRSEGDGRQSFNNATRAGTVEIIRTTLYMKKVLSAVDTGEECYG